MCFLFFGMGIDFVVIYVFNGVEWVIVGCQVECDVDVWIVFGDNMEFQVFGVFEVNCGDVVCIDWYVMFVFVFNFEYY